MTVEREVAMEAVKLAFSSNVAVEAELSEVLHVKNISE